MHLPLRYSLRFCITIWMMAALTAWGQDLGTRISVSLTPEFTTGSISGKSNDPIDLLRSARSTYKPEISLQMDLFPFLGIETGLYQKDRGLGLKTPILDDFGNTIGHSNTSSHFMYMGFPLKVNLRWEELFLSIGPSLEVLRDVKAYQNGQAIAPAYIPSRNLELVLHCQLGWEATLTPMVRGFVGISMDAQWLRPLQPLEYRYASIGLVTGFRFGAPKKK